MKNIRSAKGLAVCGSVLAFTAVIVTLNTMTASVSSAIPEGLEGLSITPSEATVAVGESIRFSAEGDYGTRTMPVRANWFLVKGVDLGALEACTNTKTCTFTAGKTAGAATIQAQIGDGVFVKTVDLVLTAKEEELVNPFKDELPEWALKPIVRMFKKLIVKGYDDGRYGPGDSVTNGQVITLLERILKHAKLVGEPGKCEQVYDDIPQGHYAFKPACLFHQQGWSVKDSLFRPDAPASRGATAGFINRVVGSTVLGAMGASSSQEETFGDVPVGHPSFTDIAVTNQTGIMTGYPTGDFGVDDDLNRAAAAVVMFRVLEKVETLGITALKGYSSDATGDVHDAAPLKEEKKEEAAPLKEEKKEEAAPPKEEEPTSPQKEEPAVPKDGDPCDDGNLCTGGDVYGGGVCKGTPKSCDDGNACTIDACDVATGSCAAKPGVAGTVCDDGNAATENDACGADALCVGTVPPKEVPPESSQSSAQSSSAEPVASASPSSAPVQELTSTARSDGAYALRIRGIGGGNYDIRTQTFVRNYSSRDYDLNFSLIKPNFNVLPAGGWTGYRATKIASLPYPGFAAATEAICRARLAGSDKGDYYVNLAGFSGAVCFLTDQGIAGKIGDAKVNGFSPYDAEVTLQVWGKGTSSQSSQPSSVTPPVAQTPKADGACILRAGNAPRGDAPDTGKDYVKKHISGVNDINGLRTACTQNVFDALLKEYCALGVSPSVQRGVLTFRDDYSISSSGCGSMGCEYATCPVTVNTDDLLYAGGIEINQNPLFIDLLTGKSTSGAADGTHDISAQTVVTFSQSCRRTGGFIKRTRCTTSAQTNFSAQRSGGSKVVALNPQKPFEQVTAADCRASLAKGGTDAPIVFGVNSSPSLVVLCVGTNDGNTAALGKFTDTYAQFKTWK